MIVSRRISSRLVLPLLAAAAWLCAAPGHALQVQNLTLYSPITGQPFDTTGVPIEHVMSDGMSDMGYDDDGCRHTAGASEYAYYVACDPHSYFSALTAEWDPQTGRFLGPVPPEIKQWVQKEFNSDWQIDVNHAFQLANQAAQASAQPPPDRKTFVMPQNGIPVEKRYRHALLCYEKRGARAAVLAKTSLMGAWSLRAYLNVPLGHQSLDGGYEEVNDRVRRHVKDGEAFQLTKWLAVYREIFEDDRLTNEGYLVAGLAYFGLTVRSGELAASRGVLEKMSERFGKLPEGQKKTLLQGISRERKRMLEEYLRFLNVATDNFIQAISEEEFTREDLIGNKLFVVAEGLRRTGRETIALDWYLALASQIETQPTLRAEMRAQGKAPAADSTRSIQVGWLADLQIERLRAAGVVHPGEISGQHKPLLMALKEGLGKPDYVNPNWRPAIGGNANDVAFMLDTIGKAVLDFNFRLGAWPSDLNEMWDRGVLKDRNRVNRFYDPAIGKPFQYAVPAMAMEEIPPRTVIVCTAGPVTSNQGDVYFAFCANMKIEWSLKPQTPGQVFVK